VLVLGRLDLILCLDQFGVGRFQVDLRFRLLAAYLAGVEAKTDADLVVAVSASFS